MASIEYEREFYMTRRTLRRLSSTEADTLKTI